MNPVIKQYSVGSALADTLDDLITANRIDPELAMKIMANFDRSVTEVLQEKVRSRLSFKVNRRNERFGGNVMRCDAMRWYVDK